MFCAMKLGALSLMNVFAILNYCSFSQRARPRSEFKSMGIKPHLGQKPYILISCHLPWPCQTLTFRQPQV